MTKQVEPREPKYLLSSKYGITWDKLNIVLFEQYEKFDGKGKAAKPTGELGWRVEGYYGSLNTLAKELVRKAYMNDEELEDLYSIVDKVNDLHKDIYKTLQSKITIKFGE